MSWNILMTVDILVFSSLPIWVNDFISESFLLISSFTSFEIVQFLSTISILEVILFSAYGTDVSLLFYMQYDLPVSVTKAPYINSPVVIYIHSFIAAVQSYIISCSVYMVGIGDKLNFFYFYSFYFWSKCGKIILHKYKFLSYVILAKT